MVLVSYCGCSGAAAVVLCPVRKAAFAWPAGVCVLVKAALLILYHFAVIQKLMCRYRG